jgi:hypothetical protein
MVEKGGNMSGSFSESFFLLTQLVKIELLNAVRYGHQAAREGKDIEAAIAQYSKTRVIFTETEEGK